MNNNSLTKALEAIGMQVSTGILSTNRWVQWEDRISNSDIIVELDTTTIGSRLISCLEVVWVCVSDG